MTHIGYLDCPSGAGGDMILAACLDAGLPLDHLRSELARLHLDGYELNTRTEIKNGLAARRLLVRIEAQSHHRHWTDIRAMIDRSDLSGPVKEKSIAIFERLAQAEGRLHGVAPEDVHFHEVGAVDSVIDIVGAAIAWEYFNLSRLHVSPLPLGAGFTQSAHGNLPLPAPATLALLENVPVYGSGLTAELVTPTAAAILTTLASEFGPWPAMTITAIGFGTGSRNLPDRANILRLAIGRHQDVLQAEMEHLIVAETNIDDMNPEILPYVMERLLQSGALDVWLTPIQMKKGRPAFQLSILARPGEIHPLTDLVLKESTTLGVRYHPVTRRALPRRPASIQTPNGQIEVKKIMRGGRSEWIPEFEACRKIAVETGRPLKDVYDDARRRAEDSEDV